MESDPTTQNTANEDQKTTSLIDLTSQWIYQHILIFQNVIDIAKLEVKLFTISMIEIALLCIFCLFLMICAWLFLSASAAAALIELGFSLALSLLFVALANGCLAIIFLLIAVNIHRRGYFNTLKLLARKNHEES